MSPQRLLPISGIGFVVLVLLAVVASGGTPGTSDSAAEIASFYNENEVLQFIMPFAFAATVPFLILFAVGLMAASRDAGNAMWGYVAIAGSILVGSVILMAAAIHFALLEAATQDVVARDALVALTAVDGSTWVAFNAGFGVMMLGAAGLLAPQSGARGWLGWIALVLGLALFIPVADFVALLGTLLWIVVTGVMLARRAASPLQEPQLGGDPTLASTT